MTWAIVLGALLGVLVSAGRMWAEGWAARRYARRAVKVIEEARRAMPGMIKAVQGG